jgi:hypothetical protein
MKTLVDRSLLTVALGVTVALFPVGECSFHSTAWGLRREFRGRTFPSDGTTRRICVDDSIVVATDEVATVRGYTEEALKWQGEPEGLSALGSLGELCTAPRRPFDFNADRIHGKVKGSVLSKIPNLIPRSVTEEMFEKVLDLQEKGWLSTNLDSVDGLPSFHLNLVSGGEPIVDMTLDATVDDDDFEICIRDLIRLVTPYIYGTLLPQVHELMNTTTIRISDVFIRRYGEEMIDGKSRNGISAHYDVYSKVTSVIALDDVSKDGTNGLYTTHVRPAEGSSSPGETSNHASLRRFFPLSCGDAVVHTWDVLHGVDVESGLDRTSLIVWCSVEEEMALGPVSPWLSSRDDLDTNDVAQFVLASALEGSEGPNWGRSEQEAAGNECSYHELYLRSASRENAFALTRMGGLLGENEISPELTARAVKVLESLGPIERLPLALLQTDSISLGLAKRFWWEGAIRGNPIAQVALADEVMVQVIESGDYDDDRLMLAGVLFALAAQQGNTHAMESLHRVVQMDLSRRDIQNDEEFLDLPLVKVANAAFSAAVA